MLIVAGDHVPVILLVEVVSSAGAALFWHSGPIWANVGVIELVTTISIVAVEAHCPAAGVNAYVIVPTVVVLIVAGAHVPVILLAEVVSNAGATLFWHSGPICANVGIIEEVTTISIVVEVAH